MKKMKKMLTGFLALAMILTNAAVNLPGNGDSMSITASAASYESLFYSVEEDHIVITGCDAAAESVVIPAEIDGLPVTSIAEDAFYNLGSLTSVTIPEGVTTIGNDAFSYCYKLTDISLPESLAEIGSCAFFECIGLEQITLPDALETIGDNAFYGCTALTSITIPDRVTAIGNETFAVCTHLSEVTIGKGVEEIGNMAFYNCMALISVKLPEGVERIVSFAFGNCTALESIYLPETLRTVAACAFSDCENLTQIYYAGSNTDWADVEVATERNEYFLNAAVKFEEGSKGDINNDGVVDSVDASLILRYAAYVGAGGTESLEIWAATV